MFERLIGKLLSPFRGWLNVRTWDQTHVPIEPEPEPAKTETEIEKVFPYPPDVPVDVLELYLGLNDAIEKKEVDAIEAMTLFTQFGFAGDVKQGLEILRESQSPRLFEGSVTAQSWKMSLEDEDVWVVREAKNVLQKEEKPTKKDPLIEEYIFPPDPYTVDGKYSAQRPVHVMPRSALLMPTHLTYEERDVAGLARKLNKHFDGDLKLKPAIAKKIKASEQPPHRVYWDDKGKMKKVPKSKVQKEEAA